MILSDAFLIYATIRVNQLTQPFMLTVYQCTFRLTLLLGLSIYATSAFAQDVPDAAPDSFRVAVETTKGRFVMQIHTAWASIGAQRVYEIARSNSYDDAPFYRVVPGFVAQFGPAGDAEARKEEGFYMPDEPVNASNQRGTIAFARGGPNSRGTHLYINMRDNSRLDTLFHNGVTGFPPVGRIVEGMEVVAQLYSGYTNAVNQDLMQTQGLPYLKDTFPELDYITSTELILSW